MAIAALLQDGWTLKAATLPSIIQLDGASFYRFERVKLIEAVYPCTPSRFVGGEVSLTAELPALTCPSTSLLFIAEVPDDWGEAK